MNIPEQIEYLRAELAKLEQHVDHESKLPAMVNIPDRAYSVGETPVTVAQYEYYCAQTGQKMPKQPGPHSPTNPVVNVTFHEAQHYATWLSEQTGEDYRLPTEDEFEHCCADHTEANPDIAVYNRNSIKPVKTKKPNRYGLYDMLGCVWEWQESFYE